MNKILVGLIITILGIMFIQGLRKRKSKKIDGRLEKFLDDSDYQRIKIITPLKCLECGECIMNSKGCCSNCVNSVNFSSNESVEIHCQEHNHDHNHKHHHHSNQGGVKGLLPLVLFPLISGIITYRIIRKIVWQK